MSPRRYVARMLRLFRRRPRCWCCGELVDRGEAFCSRVCEEEWLSRTAW